MIPRRQISSRTYRRAAAALAAGFALVGASCRTATEACEGKPLVDNLGRAAEEARVDLQWMAIQGRLDSLRATPEGIRMERLARGGLDSAIGRYRDSLRLEGGAAVSRSGCLDWKATWEGGALDRTALATTWVRALVADGAGVVEWSVPDTGSGAIRLHVVFTRAGGDGGTLDSAVFAIDSARVALERVP